MQAHEILNRYLEFFKKRGHVQIPNAPLVLQNDPTTLFTSSGMQPLVPYLLGEVHPDGNKLVDVQNCIRTQDIEEVGDNRHTTFFRMFGNWGLGSYFKEEEIPWLWTYLTDKNEGIGLDPKNMYITVFNGDEKNNIPKDTVAANLWKKLLGDIGMDTKEVELVDEETASKVGMQNGRIFYYNAKKNWWSRAGVPENMPAGEPGGPDTEIFYDFGTPHDPKFGKHCHPNCDCGRFVEICNSVFMQYQKQDDGSFKELPQRNVDFGGGFERLAAAVNNDSDVFKTDLYASIISTLEVVSTKTYPGNEHAMRVIADHMKASIYLINDGVLPSNKEQGYVLRRLLRRSVVKMYELTGGFSHNSQVHGFRQICESVIKTEENIDKKISMEKLDETYTIVKEELVRFSESLEKGLKILNKVQDVDAKVAFDLYQSYGFPFEITQEILAKNNKSVSKEAFEAEFKKHKDQSRTASAGKFRGGLADHSEKTIMGHTATHLMHQALRDVLGNHVHQTGSNITSERIRFDFNYENKLTDEQMKTVENLVNEKIKENLPVHFELIDTKQAHDMGAIGLFMDTYGEKSKIYFIGGDNPYTAKHTAYSIEFCGGPHVNFTGELKSFKIVKQENLGKNQKRLYSVVG